MAFCWHDRSVWVDYIDGEISESDRRRLAERLARCSMCREEHHRLVSLMGILHQDAGRPLDVSGGEAFVFSLRQKLKSRSGDRRSWRAGAPWMGWATAAAAASLLFGILWSVSPRPFRPRSTFSVSLVKSPSSIRAPRRLSPPAPSAKMPEGSIRLASISVPPFPSARQLGLGSRPRQKQPTSLKGSDSV